MFGCKSPDKQVIIDTKPKEIQPLVKESEEETQKTQTVKDEEREEFDDGEEIPIIRLDTNDVKLEWVDGKGKLMTAYAKKFSGSQKNKILFLNDVITLLYENGVKSVKLKSKNAKFDVNKKTVSLSGGVVVTSYLNESKLNANRVFWDSTKNKIFAEDGILNTPFGKVYGKNFILDTKLETFEVNDKKYAN